MQVAQPAFAVFHVRLDQIARLPAAPHTIFPLGKLGGDKLRRCVADDVFVETHHQFIEQFAVAEQEAPAIVRLREIGRFYRRYWSERPDYFSIFSVLHLQEFIGQLSPALLAEVRGTWERPLRRLEQVIADGVRRGELRRVDPWVMANVIWRSGNAAIAVLVSPRRTRLIDCSPEALYDSTLEVLLQGLAVREPTDRTPSPS